MYDYDALIDYDALVDYDGTGDGARRYPKKKKATKKHPKLELVVVQEIAPIKEIEVKPESFRNRAILLFLAVD